MSEMICKNNSSKLVNPAAYFELRRFEAKIYKLRLKAPSAFITGIDMYSIVLHYFTASLKPLNFGSTQSVSCRLITSINLPSRDVFCIMSWKFASLRLFTRFGVKTKMLMAEQGISKGTSLIIIEKSRASFLHDARLTTVALNFWKRSKSQAEL